MSAITQMYLDDAYCFEHDAQVVRVSGRSVVLDRTCMYPGGGGQPPDSGTIEFDDGLLLHIAEVNDDDGGTLLHQSSDALPGGLPGRSCRVKLDGNRRLGLMRHHTALHVFNTVMLRDFGGWITGVSIGPDVSHIDFKIDGYNDEMRDQVESKVNEVLNRELDIRDRYISEDEFRQRPDLIRTLEVTPPVVNGRVRVVSIGDFEEQACGGTHVRNTREVGLLSVTKVRSKGRINRRFYVTLAMIDDKRGI